MPNVEGKYVTPDYAIEHDRCPECGADLKLTNPVAHRRTHWFVDPPKGENHNESRRRIALYDQYLKKQAAKQAKPAEGEAE